MILNPFKKVISWYELKKYNDEDINKMLIELNKVKSINMLPSNERKNYIIVRKALIKEAKRRGIL